MPSLERSGDNISSFPTGSTATTTTVSRSNVSQLLIPANSNRIKILISNNEKDLFLTYTSPATQDFKIWKVKKDGTVEENQYTGAIYGIWQDNGSGEATITEITL